MRRYSSERSTLKRIANAFRQIGRTNKNRIVKGITALKDATVSGIFKLRHAVTHNKVVARFSLPKRFVQIASIALVVALVPTIALSANGNMAQKKAAEQQQVVADQPETATVPQEETPDVVSIPDVVVDQSTTDASNATEVTGDLTVADTPEEAPVEEQEPESKYLDLQPDTNHPDVIKLQERLIELHYMDNDEPTDYYGSGTQEAVKYFQRKNGLTMDAVAGAQTQEILFSDEAKPYSASLEARGADVESIQARLTELGYDVGDTGYFGTETEKAVKYFQRMNGLDDDGSVGYETKEVLYSSNATPSEEYLARKEAEENGTSDEGSSEESSSKSSDSDKSSEKPKEESKKEESESEESAPAPAPAADPGNVEAFIDAAMAQVGKSYVLGGKGPNTFDCSGFVYYALNQSGNSIGYMTSGGWANSGYTTVGFGDLQRGDVICMTGHVGIYLGDGMMVDASSSKGQIVVREVGSWARSVFKCGKRPL